MIDFDNIYRQFISDPSESVAIRLIQLMRQIGKEMPRNYNEISSFCRHSKFAISRYIIAMNYGETAIVLQEFFRTRNNQSLKDHLQLSKEIVQKAVNIDNSGFAVSLLGIFSNFERAKYIDLFKETKDWVEKFIEQSEKGRSACAAYSMFTNYGSSKEWCIHIVEKTNQRDSSYPAYWLYLNYGYPLESFKKIVDKNKSAKFANEIARIYSINAYGDVEYNSDLIIWAEDVISKSRDSDIGKFSYEMCRHLGSPRLWAEKNIERSVSYKNRHDLKYVYSMVKHCGSSHKWAERVIEKAINEYDCKYREEFLELYFEMKGDNDISKELNQRIREKIYECEGKDVR